MPDKIDVDALIADLRVEHRCFIESVNAEPGYVSSYAKAANALSALKAERDELRTETCNRKVLQEGAERDRDEMGAACDALRADLERARKVLHLYGCSCPICSDGCIMATACERLANEALSPSPAPVETPPEPYEPSEAEVAALMCAFLNLSGFRISETIAVPLLIAAHNARSAKT